MGQWLKDYGQIISVTLIPIFIWVIGVQFQNRAAKKKAKIDLFLILMANRKKIPITVQMADALNQIDVVFQSDLKVRAAWRDYYNSLHPRSQHNEIANSFLLDLLSEIANVLGYRNLKQTEIDLFYHPQAFLNQFQNQEMIFQEQARVLLHSKNLAEGFSDEEYQKHLQFLEDRKRQT